MMAGVRGFLGRSWVMVRGSGVLVIVQWSNEGCLWLKGVLCVPGWGGEPGGDGEWGVGPGTREIEFFSLSLHD